MRRTAGVVLIAVAALGGGAVAAGAVTHGATPADRLPDLVQERPRDISLTRVGGRWRLGFTSAVHNAGDGPLRIVGTRRSRADRQMVARQIIVRADASTRRAAGVAGVMRYVRSADHSHWHLMPFERYELLAEAGGRPVRATKTGFCLGDRYAVEPAPRGAVPRAVHRTRCGLHRPGLLSVLQGISVGWADDYPAYLEGQSFDVSALPAGTYRIVHTVDAAGRILESDRTNNRAEVTIRLTRAAGTMRVRVVTR